MTQESTNSTLSSLRAMSGGRGAYVDEKGIRWVNL